MALLFCDGFDRYQDTTDLATQGYANDNPTNITLDGTGSQWGGKCLKVGDISAAGISTFQGIARPISRKMTGSVLRMAWWMKTSSGITLASGLTGGEAYFSIGRGSFGTSNADNISFMLNASGFLTVYKLDSASSNSRNLVATGSTNLADGNWHHVEVEFTINTATGSVNVWVDGGADATVTGVDTSDAGVTTPESWLHWVKFSHVKRSPGATDFCWWDDVIIWDDDTSNSENTMSGALPNHTHRIETKTPNSDNSVQFTRSTGANNYANVDDTAPYNSDTDYNSSSTNGHVDLFGMASSSVYADLIFAVNVVTVVRKTAASTGIPKIRAKAKRNATTRSSAKTGVWHPSAYTVNEHVMCKDPDGAAAWTNTTLQSTLFGYERTD